MIKTRIEKGITLVALIITIVVLFILAGITISSIKEESIIGYANNAVKLYNQKQNEENTILGQYEEYLKEHLTGDNKENLEYVPQGREGKKVRYDSNNDGTKEEWIIITDRDGKLEIVSATAMGNLPMGFNDISVTVNKDLTGDGKIDSHDIMIASYNSAITTINNYCKSLITATDNDGVRSVGNSTDTSKLYSSTYLSSIFPNISIKAGDENHLEDFDKLTHYGIADVDATYFIASREIVVTEEGFVKAIVKMIGAHGKVSEGNAVTFNPNGIHIGGSGHDGGVRPVVINPKNYEIQN